MKRRFFQRINRKALLACLCLVAVHPFIQGGCGGGGGSSSPPPPASCDLRVVSVLAPGGTWEPGDSFTVDNDVINDGPEDCPGYVVTFWALDAAAILPDIELASYARGGLVSGADHALTSPVTLPWATPDGDYYVALQVSYAGDPDTSNNIREDLLPITVLGWPDLYDGGPAFSAWNIVDDTFYIVFRVCNGGTADAVPVGFPANNIDTDIFASLDTTITATDYRLGRAYITWIPAGNYVDVGLYIPLADFPVVPVGTYYIGWIIDQQTDVAESDELNNTACITDWLLTVTLPAAAAVFVPLNTDAEDSPATRTLTIKYRQARR